MSIIPEFYGNPGSIDSLVLALYDSYADILESRIEYVRYMLGRVHPRLLFGSRRSEKHSEVLPEVLIRIDRGVDFLIRMLAMGINVAEIVMRHKVLDTGLGKFVKIRVFPEIRFSIGETGTIREYDDILDIDSTQINRIRCYLRGICDWRLYGNSSPTQGEKSYESDDVSHNPGYPRLALRGFPTNNVNLACYY